MCLPSVTTQLQLSAVRFRRLVTARRRRVLPGCTITSVWTVAAGLEWHANIRCFSKPTTRRTRGEDERGLIS